ncbi:MAG: peptide chain release factor N(5)-glutamine methyltransferase [Spirochaetota bacterium]|nr:peptide chain release factor N(5)-glutamine methyltransferase [Spirochaetota bacterium]
MRDQFAKNRFIKQPMTISELLKEVVPLLKVAGIENPELDSELIISSILNIQRYKVLIDKDRELSYNNIEKINKLIERRIKGEPVGYLIGKKEFYSLEFSVNHSVLIPRPETEFLVDMAIYHAQSGAQVLDIGTGSGAIAIALKYNRSDLNIFASDISKRALKVAQKNANTILKNNSIIFKKSDLFSSFDGMRFDIIVTNPPYIDSTAKGTLQKEISYEPSIALFADDNGKEIINRIVLDSANYLNNNGLLIIEIGSEMKDHIIKLGQGNNFSVSVINDYAGLPRVAILKNDREKLSLSCKKIY